MTVLSPDYQTPQRMAAKRYAISFPEFRGKRVLDVGTDFGCWAFQANEQGAAFVLGLDRGREIRGVGMTDLVAMNNAKVEREGRENIRFESINLGRSWRDFGHFDVVLVMSVYHHVYEGCGDHRAVWTWLARHCSVGGVVIFEGPVDDSDPVVRRNVSDANRVGFTRDAILDAASGYFDATYVGPAVHEPTREVWTFRRWPPVRLEIGATIRPGAGGASTAFDYASGRRCREIERVLGFVPVPGSLNLVCDEPFDWSRGYVRAQVLDVADRTIGLHGEWIERWARFYPVTVNGIDAWAFRFEGERYPETFVELIAPVRLRDCISGERVTLVCER